MGFKDRLAAYNASKETTPALNPPEAAAVLANVTTPEVENTAPKEPASVAVSASSPEVAPAAPKRTRRTKAQIEADNAAAGVTSGAEEPAEESAPPSGSESFRLPTVEVSAPPAILRLLDTRALANLVYDTQASGFTITIKVG